MGEKKLIHFTSFNEENNVNEATTPVTTFNTNKLVTSNDVEQEVNDLIKEEKYKEMYVDPFLENIIYKIRNKIRNKL